MSNCVSYISINDYVEKLKDKIKQIDSDRIKGFYNNLLLAIHETLESNPSYDFKLNSLSNLDCFTLFIIFEENGSLNFHLTNKQVNKRLSGNYELDNEHLNHFDDLFEWFDEK